MFTTASTKFSIASTELSFASSKFSLEGIKFHIASTRCSVATIELGSANARLTKRSVTYEPHISQTFRDRRVTIFARDKTFLQRVGVGFAPQFVHPNGSLFFRRETRDTKVVYLESKQEDFFHKLFCFCADSLSEIVSRPSSFLFRRIFLFRKTCYATTFVNRCHAQGSLTTQHAAQ